MQIIEMPLDQLSQDPANVRKHDARNIEAIKASVARFGVQKPLIIDENNVIRAGNGTFQAAKLLNLPAVPCIRTSLRGSEATAYAIADNRCNELSDWDVDALNATLQSLTAEGLSEAAGYTADEIAALMPQPPLEITGTDPGEGRYSEQYAVIITCKDEADQEETYNRLTELGYECRVVNT